MRGRRQWRRTERESQWDPASPRGGAPSQFERTFRIGDVARFLGISPQSLRDYEELGVVAPEKTPAGTRSYDFGDLLTLESFRMWRQLDTSLSDAIRLTTAGDERDVIDSLADCSERYEQLTRRARKRADRISYIHRLVSSASAAGMRLRRECMSSVYVLSLVYRGQPLSDERLKRLVAAWLEHVPCVFYVNVFRGTRDSASTWMGLGVHVDDVVGWDPTANAEGLIRLFEGGHAIHGYGWHDLGADVWRDIDELDRAAPWWHRGRPKTFLAEPLITTNTSEGQRIFWSQWLTY